MGKSSSKQVKLPYLVKKHTKQDDIENLQGKYQDLSDANVITPVGKRNTYLECPGGNRSKTSAGNSLPAIDVSDSEYEAVSQVATPTNDPRTERKPDYENIPYQNVKVINDYETFETDSDDPAARSCNQDLGTYSEVEFNDGSGGEFQPKECEATEGYENVLEESNRYRLSRPYVNMMFLTEQEQIPARKKSGGMKRGQVLSIRRHYREVKDRVSIESVCDYLIQEGVLLQCDLENIMLDSYPRHARADMLLQTMLRKNRQDVFKAFCLALRSTDCKDLADKLEDTEGVFPDKSYKFDWSLEEIVNAWPSIEKYLMEELLSENIIDYFMQENIFSIDEYAAVFQCRRGKKMTEKLLKKMRNKLPKAFCVLLYALEDVDKENKDMVEDLENLITTGNDRQEGEKQSETSVSPVGADEIGSSAAAPLSTNLRFTVNVGVVKDGNVMETVEVEIDKTMNNTDNACFVQIFLPLTHCEITKSERGCVIVHLRPHSKHAFDKLSKFCKSGELNKFVLNLLREKNIISALPAGEVCVNIKVLYHDGDVEAKEADTEEPETDLKQSIKDNWSFLCEELDVKALISGSIDTSVFTDKETSELEGRAANDRHEGAAYFLTCLLDKGQTGIEFLIKALEKRNKMKIINRLQQVNPLCKNPQRIKENMLVHFELIVQEIDPSQFKETFADRNILDKKFFTDLREKHLRRRCRAALFLREVLNKGNRAICALVDVLTEMGCQELLAKLASTEDNMLIPNQESNGVVMDVYNAPSPEGLIWSCCLKVNVEKKNKDENKEQMSGSGTVKEEPLYMNLRWDNIDEGIGGAEDKCSVTLRSKEGMGQSIRPVTHPESTLSHYSESDKCLTYPRIRESDEGMKNMLSFITSVNDSGIDINDSK